MKTIIWYIKFFSSLLINFLKSGSLKNQNQVDILVQSWSKNVIDWTGSSVKVLGEEKIPNESVVFVSNHQSNFDIPLLLGYIKKPKGFIAKKELENFPFVSFFMKKINCIFMDRKSARSAIDSINQGAKILKQGYSMVIFPEGTRSKDGKLGIFKAGSMKLATKAKVAIVPVAIIGTYDMMKPKSPWIYSNSIELRILDPIYTENLKKDEEKLLHQQVRKQIQEEIEKN